MLTYKDLNLFTKGYIDAIFFTECEELENMTFEDIAPATLTKIIEDCTSFELSNCALLEKAGDPEQNGHDFWLTRNGHGAGFWDRDYGKAGDDLTTACEAFKPLNAIKGDDNLLYLE